MGKINFVELKGDYEERGYQHGRQLRGEIHSFYEEWISNSQKGSNSPSEEELLGYAGLLLPDAKEYAPELIREIEGIAKGAEIGFEKVFFLNCFDEICSYDDEKVSTNFKGCTVLAAAGSAVSSGNAIIGQGWDVDGWYPSVIFHSLPTDQDPEYLCYTHPGIVGGTGLNSAGIASVWNSLKTTDARPGVPATFLCRKIMGQRTLSDAVGAVIFAKRANGTNLLIANPYAAINIETTAEKFYTNYVQEIFSHANHIESDYLRPYDMGMGADTLIRSGRMLQMLVEHKGAIDVEVCKSLLSDHVNYPNSICRHASEKSEARTIAAMIYSPADGLMLVSNGNPCEVDFDEYSLSVSTLA